MEFNEANPYAASRLALAVRVGDENLVTKLLKKGSLKKGSPVELKDNRGWNAIHEAVGANQFGCLKLLLENGSDYINEKSEEGETPLLLACLQNNDVELFRLLMEHGADVNLPNNENLGPLHAVCRNGNLDAVKILIEAGADIDAVCYDLWTPLHYAVNYKQIEVMKYLLKEGADVYKQEDSGRTPLFMAAQVCDMTVIEPLLKYYHFVDTRALDGATALMLAAQNLKLNVVNELLRKGANPNLVAEDGTMALHLAVHAGDVKLTELLLRVSSREVIIDTHKNKSPLNNLCCLAIDCENLQVLEAVLSSNIGKDIIQLPVYNDASSDELMSRYHAKTTSIGFLLKHKMNDIGYLTLHYIELLLKYGCPLNPVYQDCIPPLSVLCFLEENDIALRCFDLFLAHGADIEYKIRDCDLPFAVYKACESGNCGLLLKLLRAGCSGTPDDMLMHVFSESIHMEEKNIGKMINFLLDLGITVSHMQLLHMPMFILQKCLPSLSLGKFGVCSLLKLCRTAVRKHLRQPFSESLNQLEVPKCIKESLLYEIL